MDNYQVSFTTNNRSQQEQARVLAAAFREILSWPVNNPKASEVDCGKRTSSETDAHNVQALAQEIEPVVSIPASQANLADNAPDLDSVNGNVSSGVVDNASLTIPVNSQIHRDSVNGIPPSLAAGVIDSNSSLCSLPAIPQENDPDPCHKSEVQRD